ncbi:MAG: hypothetical protein EA349_14715 [Halomonadaceae bacterium]|nr:MAG: hypothetical protein EA349_14715 [Halomonadaceae bacterium]
MTTPLTLSKRLSILFTAAALVLASNASHGLSVTASAGSDYYSVDVTQPILPRLRAGVGYLNTDDADIYTGSLMFAPITPVVDLTIGARYQYQDTDFGEGGGVSVGGSAFVGTPIPMVSVGGHGFYTPEDLTHGDLEESYEYAAQVRARLTPQTYASASYRFVRSDFDGTGRQTLHSGPVFGVSVGF